MDESKGIMNTGLRDVVVASTRISDVVSEKSKLIYRGYNIAELAGKATFEEVAHLLLHERLPAKAELDAFAGGLAALRGLPEPLLAALSTRPADSMPMDILQAAVAMLANHDPGAAKITREATLAGGMSLIAKIPKVVAAWHRIRSGLPPVPPDPALGHAANFLHMLAGEAPDPETAAFFDTCLVIHAEHSFNASTFTARQVASTRAHVYASVSAALGSLSGELHGGANTRVMRMLQEIATPDRIAPYVDRVLDSGGLIMGLGHAVYKNGDPRVLVLAPMSRRLGERANDTRWYDLTALLEATAKEAFKKRKNLDIYPNVDFYSASVYHYMNIPADLFTPVFAIARIAGWTAHVLEEQFAGAAPKPALYRPASEYTGEYCGPSECSFVPMEKRE